MIFLYPLGLLGLFGVPILILVYILKRKYTEQTVASTYLWTLSERFLKRRNPLSRLTGIIGLILQLLAVVAISLTIAHPVLIFENAAEEHCFILDASGSMLMESEGETRFARAKAEIADKIQTTVDGSVYTLVTVGDTTNIVFERMTNKEQALLLLSELSTVNGTADFTEAIGIAQGYFNENNACNTYLFTDKAYEKHDNIELHDLSCGEANTALSDVTYTLAGGILTVNGNAISYTRDATVTVKLYVDESETPTETATLSLATGVETPFVMECTADDFDLFALRIEESDAQALDNGVTVYNLKSENSYKTLIVSDTPFFLESVLSSVSAADLDTVAPADYKDASGYGLYIFDSFVPETLPRDGAVWFFNPTESLDDTGFSVQGEVVLDAAEELTLSDSSASIVEKLTQGMSGDGIFISRYVKCGLYENFSTLLSYRGNPVVFTGVNTYGNREVVFAFSLHDSNFPLLLDYLILMDNVVRFSFPTVLEKTDYTVGDTLTVNVIANCDSIRVESPNGNLYYLDTGYATAEMALTEAGAYTVTLTVADTPREFHVFAALGEEERVPDMAADEISVIGSSSDGGYDGRFDRLVILFVALAVLFAADWMVYCYEKYQLR